LAIAIRRKGKTSFQKRILQCIHEGSVSLHRSESIAHIPYAISIVESFHIFLFERFNLCIKSFTISLGQCKNDSIHSGKSLFLYVSVHATINDIISQFFKESYKIHCSSFLYQHTDERKKRICGNFVFQFSQTITKFNKVSHRRRGVFYRFQFTENRSDFTVDFSF